MFPATSMQPGIVHLVRHSLDYVSGKRRAAVAAASSASTPAPPLAAAAPRPGQFEAKGDGGYPPIGQSWRRHGERLIPLFDFPPETRRVIYTPHAIESVNYSLRKLARHRGAFPSDAKLIQPIQLLYLALRNISRKWTLPIRDGKAAEPMYDPIRGEPSSAVNPFAGYPKICTPSLVKLGRRDKVRVVAMDVWTPYRDTAETGAAAGHHRHRPSSTWSAWQTMPWRRPTRHYVRRRSGRTVIRSIGRAANAVLAAARQINH